MSDEDQPRSAISDELGVPPTQPNESDGDHILPLDELRYPTLTFSDGSISPSEGLQLRDTVDREALQSILRDLDDAITSHDLCLEGPERRVTLGLGPGDVSARFTADENHRGTLELTISLKAKALTYASRDDRAVGARGGRGFIPMAMLTGGIDPGEARCYNWIEDPTAGLDESTPGDDE